MQYIIENILRFNKSSFFIFNLICASILILSSCEKVVEVDINNNESKYFIEAHLFNEMGNNLVYIRKTQNVFDENLNPVLQNAVVSISEGVNTYDLSYNQNGYYTSQNLIGEVGKTYSLTVEIDGNTFTSNSIMPKSVGFYETFYALPFDPNPDTGDTITFCTEGDYFVFNIFTDHADEENYYWIDYDRNGNADEQLYISDDLTIDGAQTELPFFNNCFFLGDEVNTLIYAINEPVYNYLFVLSNIANNGGPFGDVTPQNPEGNIVGENVLGYFNVAAIKRSSLIVGE